MSVSSRRFAWTVRVSLFVTALGGILFATGCGNVSSMGTVPISVTITNKVTTALTNNGTFTFNATVRNDPANKGVTWTLTEIDGTTCPSGCGAISNATSTSVTYTPPNSLFGGVFDTPIVVATSASDPTKFDQDNVTLIATTVTITNKVKAVQAGTGAITLHAVVANDPVRNGV